MSFLKSVVGGVFGFVVGGPLGAIVGASLAYQLGNSESEADTSESSQTQMAFFVATFSVMGCMAKINGRVCPAAISFAKQIMNELQLNAELRTTAIDLFRQGKQVDFPLDHVLAEFYKECRQSPALIQRFVEIQLQTAIVDGTLTSTEDELLWRICHQLKISRFHYQRTKMRLFTQQYFYQSKIHSPTVRPASRLAEAYQVLGVSPDASQTEIKKAYRRLMSQHHPDKLVAKGLSDDRMRLAKEKTQQISKAYETIQKLGSKFTR
ncbi:MAG: co-chaperone DjlA [Methylococcaceae bacterium]|nr:co-chaperone DjlA [Methylococcaceae bacterium]MDD1610793.1 co-chaperone DjlA [Methylococcaceae bacterium]